MKTSSTAWAGWVLLKHLGHTVLGQGPNLHRRSAPHGCCREIGTGAAQLEPDEQQTENELELKQEHSALIDQIARSRSKRCSLEQARCLSTCSGCTAIWSHTWSLSKNRKQALTSLRTEKEQLHKSDENWTQAPWFDSKFFSEDHNRVSELSRKNHCSIWSQTLRNPDRGQEREFFQKTKIGLNLDARVELIQITW
jgi:hypothetical protein